MRTILFGNIERWSSAVDIIIKYRSDIQIIGLSSLELGPFKDSDATVTLDEAKELFSSGIVDSIVNISTENEQYYELLKENGFSNIYGLPYYLYRQEDNYFIEDECFVYPYKDIKPVLQNLEFHLADHCNLNCKGCAHFANLVPYPVFADLEQFKKDCRQLSILFSNIQEFYLLGGEPLLNADIADYIVVVREFFPYANLKIVTNGLLLLAMKADVISCIRENRVVISVSAYQCLDMEKIYGFVEEYSLNVEYRMVEGNGKEWFTKYINPMGNSDAKEIFAQCPRSSCTFLEKGRMAACCNPFVIKYFNQYFGEDIPEMEAIDLYEPGLTGREVLKRLKTPMDLCRYCGKDEFFLWDIAKPPYKKEDWCI